MINRNNNLNKYILNNKGSGIGVILYGMTLLLILIFTAVNIVNSKTIESGYNSLRDAVQSASAGSVIHLLTSNLSEDSLQYDNMRIMSARNEEIEATGYDVYLQLALGYLINRDTSAGSGTTVKDGEINNFLKLDHQKVVNSTMALLADAVSRSRGSNHDETITNIEKYKILMFFIEPYVTKSNQKYFEIVAYSNEAWVGGDISGRQYAGVVGIDRDNMIEVYRDIESTINGVVNGFYDDGTRYNINLNANGTDLAGKVREMETYPHYLIVVKDFALPTIFDGVDTNDREGAGIRSIFTSLSGDGKLHTPMCALNTGKVQRQSDEVADSKNWRRERWYTNPTKN